MTDEREASEGAEQTQQSPRYGMRQIPHVEALGVQRHHRRQVHAPLGLQNAREIAIDKLAYNLGRTWSAKGWPLDANPYSAISYPVEHAGFVRGWERWAPHWVNQGVVMHSRDELDRGERFAIQRYIISYARRVPSPMFQPPLNRRRK